MYITVLSTLWEPHSYQDISSHSCRRAQVHCWCIIMTFVLDIVSNMESFVLLTPIWWRTIKSCWTRTLPGMAWSLSYLENNNYCYYSLESDASLKKMECLQNALPIGGKNFLNNKDEKTSFNCRCYCYKANISEMPVASKCYTFIKIENWISITEVT